MPAPFSAICFVSHGQNKEIAVNYLVDTKQFSDFGGSVLYDGDRFDSPDR